MGPAFDRRGRGRGRGVFDMDSQLHSAVAESPAAEEIVLPSYIERDYVSSGASGPIVERVIGVTEFVVGGVHFQDILLVPVVHKD